MTLIDNPMLATTHDQTKTPEALNANAKAGRWQQQKPRRIVDDASHPLVSSITNDKWFIGLHDELRRVGVSLNRA